MGDPLETLKAELERFGEANDAATNERPRRMLNITRDTGEFLVVLVRATAARRVLEIGTSNGYSTLWLADAARAIAGFVTTVEFAEYKIGLASANFARSGLSAFIKLVHDDAGRLLQRSDPSAYDLIFLDSERPEYPGWWPHLRRVLRPGGLLIIETPHGSAERSSSACSTTQGETSREGPSSSSPSQTASWLIWARFGWCSRTERAHGGPVRPSPGLPGHLSGGAG